AEFMALGASYWLRCESGYNESRSRVSRDQAENIAADFPELFRHIRDEGFTLTDPGNVEPIEDEYTDEALQRCARMGVDTVDQEETYQYDDDDERCEVLDAFCSDQTVERITGWLRKGYVRATERFEHHDAFTLAETVFNTIEERLDDWLKRGEGEGTEVEITIDLENYHVSIETVIGEGETDYCDECDGTGELDGEDEGNFHDCPEGCIEEGNDDCKGCAGKGYIAPPVKCHCDEGEISLEYRESI
ncbi:unnamed protein product, partial [marine sediment metagenome]